MHVRHHVRWIASVAALLVVMAGIAAPAPAATAVTVVDRYDGHDRYAASASMSRQMSTGSTVFLASGEKFPDALAAAPVAAAERAHMLLTRERDIPPVIEDEIRRIAPESIVLVGSEATLSANVRARAAAIAPGARIERIDGIDRVHVSMLLLDRLRATIPAADVWVASGRTFPDALAAGAVAARRGQGLILTMGAGPRFQQDVQARLAGTSRFLIAGAEVTVDDAVRAMLEQTGRPVTRHSGPDRYATANAINRAFTTGSSDGAILLASGAKFPDALGGAVLAGRTDRPLYLTPGECAATNDVLLDTNRIGARSVIALGGPPTVSPAAARLVPCGARTPISQLTSDVTNARTAVGAAPLARLDCLDALAQGWANQMAARSLSGSSHNPSLDAQARACGMRAWSENVGRTVGSAPDVARMMTTWLASPAHRANIERSTREHIGIGIASGANGNWYYVLVLGTD